MIRSLFSGLGRTRPARPSPFPGPAPRGDARACAVEPLEERVLMAMAKAAGGSGYSANLAASGPLRQQQLICDPVEPRAGSTSTLYDASKVSIIGAAPGPGYDNKDFQAMVEVQLFGGQQRRLQSLASFLQQPSGVETGYVQVRFQLEGQAGQLQHPRDWEVLDEKGMEGVDTHVLRFQLRPNTPTDADLRYRVYAEREGVHSNPEDFLIVNDGTGKRLGPADLSPADASTKPTTGSIHGTTFEDANADGMYNAGDKPVGGATVYLDLDGDRALDPTEPRQVSDAEDGTYLFDGLAPGRYSVREVTPAGFIGELTVPAEGAHLVSVAPGRRIRFVDFGNLRPGTISGTVFNDLNGNGVRDRTELGGVAGATIYVDLNRNGAIDASEPRDVSTSPLGAWSIGGLAPGTYVIRQITPPGYVQTAPSAFGVVTLTGSGDSAIATFGDHAVGPRVTGVYVLGSSWTGDFLNHLGRSRLGDAKDGYLVDPASQLRALPWTSVNAVSIRFDSPVRVDAADLTVRGAGGLVYGSSEFFYNAPTMTAHWLLSRPVTADRLLLSLNADDGGVVGANGEALDGEWANGNDAYPSGNGTAGGDFNFGLNVLGGDATGDGSVNALDLSFIKQRLNRTVSAPGTGNAAYSIFADVTGDGRINALDTSAAKQRLNRRLPPILVLPLPVLPAEPQSALEGGAVTKDVFADSAIL